MLKNSSKGTVNHVFGSAQEPKGNIKKFLLCLALVAVVAFKQQGGDGGTGGTGGGGAD